MSEPKRETTEEVRERLYREAREHSSARLQAATSINSSDAALRDLNWKIKRIDRMTDEELAARALLLHPKMEKQ